MKILIDNGHGIDTPGKRSPDGILREYAWNREIAARIVAALTDLRLDAQLLVPELEDRFLAERCRRVNEICRQVGKDNAILISIHCNAAGTRSKTLPQLRQTAFPKVPIKPANRHAKFPTPQECTFRDLRTALKATDIAILCKST